MDLHARLVARLWTSPDAGPKRVEDGDLPDIDRPGDRQAGRGIEAAAEHVADGVAGLAAEIPGGEHGAGALEQPGHRQRPAAAQQHDGRLAGIEHGVGERRLLARQARPGAATGLAAHVAGLADAEDDEVGLTRQFEGGGNAAQVLAVDLDAAGVFDLALRPGLAQAVEQADHLLAAASARPRPEHFRGVVGERAEHGDAARRLRDRQHAVAIAEQHHRAPRGLAGDVAMLGFLRRREHGRLLAIGIVEQAEPRLEGQHAPHGGVEIGHGDGAALERHRQAVGVGAGHHVDVDAGLEGEGGGGGNIGGDSMRHQLGDGVVVADVDAVEAPASAHQVLQHGAVGRHRHALEIGEGGHEGGAAGIDRRLEGRQVGFVEGALGDFHLGVVAAGQHGAVGGQVLGGGGDGVGGGEVRSLEAAHLGLGEARREPGILAGAFGDAAPARIAADVEHGREGEREALGRRFERGDARGALPQIDVEGRGLRQRDRKHRAVAVDDVVAEEQGNAEAGLLDRHALHLAGELGAVEIQHAAELAGLERRHVIPGHDRAGHGHVGREHIELADLLLDGHGAEELLDALGLVL